MAVELRSNVARGSDAVSIDFEQFRMNKDGPKTLPNNRFTSKEFMQLEYKKLWPYVWQMVGREDEVPKVGDYMEYSIGPYTILIVRSAPNTLKALSNTCRHRGRQLREGRGNAKELRCVAHAWRYNLDGTIKEAVDVQEFEPELVEPPCLNLPEYRLETFGGWIFINLDPNAVSLMDYLDPIPQWLSLDMSKWVTTRRRSTIIRCNWKLGMDAFRDAYHLQGTHPQSVLYSGGDLPVDVQGFECFGGLTAYQSNGKGRFSNHGHGHMGPPKGDMAWDLVLAPGPSARISSASDPKADVREMIRGYLAMLVEVDDPFRLGNQDAVNAMAEKLANEYPYGAPLAELGKWWADLRRKQYAPSGVDLSRYTDSELMTVKYGMIGPNLWVANCSVTDGNFFTFRPNGMDPDTCILDEWMAELVPDPEATKKKRIKPEFYPDFYENKNWGTFLWQDLGNVIYMQRGMHHPTQDFMRFGVKDALMIHGHASIDEYLTK